MYKRNVAELRKLNPDLCEKIKDNENNYPDWMVLINDTKNFKIQLKNKKIFWAYDKQHPKKECEKVFETISLRSDCATVLFGVGCGHLLYTMLQKAEKGHKIIVYEKHTFFLKYAFNLYNFSKWIKSGDLTICTAAEEAQYMISLIDSNVVIQDWGVVVEKYVSLIHDYQDAYNAIGHTLNQIRCNTGTVMGAGVDLAMNDITNLPYVLRHKGVNVLKNLTPDMPAVCVATGPSLKKNIHLLKDNQDKVIIIAVAQALRYLLAYGIIPDFICTVDYGETNMYHFEGLYDCGVSLVALNRVYRDILNKWQGKIFIMSSYVYSEEENAATLLNDKGCVDQGGSVAHSCLGLAHMLGCNPIMLVGHDLSLGERSHIANVDSGGSIRVDENGIIQWYVDDPTSNLHGKEYSMGPAIHTPGYFGDQVLTNTGLYSFVTAFEIIIKRYTDKSVLNCTEGGAHIKGTIRMSFDLALLLYGQNTIDKSSIQLLDDKEIEQEQLFKKAKKLLHKDIDLLKEVIEHCKKALWAADEMEKEINSKNSKLLKSLIKDNEEHSNKAHELTKKNPLLTVAIYKESRMIHNKDLNVKGKINHLLKNENDFKTRITRNKLILEAAKTQAEKLLDVYKKTMKLLLQKIGPGIDAKTAMENLKTALLPKPQKEEIDVDVLREKLDKGNWAAVLVQMQVLEYAEKKWDIEQYKVYDNALKMRDDEYRITKQAYAPTQTDDRLIALQLMEKAKKAGQENNFKLSLEYLQAAYGLDPDNTTIVWGYATALYHDRNLEHALKLFEQLCEKEPDNLRFQFEMALIYIHIDANKALSIFENVMSKTNQFDYFYAGIADYYEEIGEHKKADQARKKYLVSFPAALL